ncbi:MAG TPA: hypothetical protein VFV67_02620 [Actinophytocola sp.]|uniref:hypothetical protein n=1 Tax=Actinophytocola sp. TaxID=1872138 RepID=UPI002DBD57AB|nr:hypothetical protein [Actinophytocola sp.]HEU5469520.1 hypothetical protein [Actinophytocola sp.]
MQHILRFRAGDNGGVLLEEPTLAYGLACGYERGAAELGVIAGQWVRMELFDDAGRLLDWRTYVAPVTGRPFPSPPAFSQRGPTDRVDPSGVAAGEANSVA